MRVWIKNGVIWRFSAGTSCVVNLVKLAVAVKVITDKSVVVVIMEGPPESPWS